MIDREAIRAQAEEIKARGSNRVTVSGWAFAGYALALLDELARVEKERDEAHFQAHLTAATETTKGYMRLIDDCQATPPCGICRVCTNESAERLWRTLAAPSL